MNHLRRSCVRRSCVIACVVCLVGVVAVSFGGLAGEYAFINMTFGDVYGLIIRFDQPVEEITVVGFPDWRVRELGHVSILEGRRMRGMVRVRWMPDEARVVSYDWLYMPTHEISEPYWVDWQISISVSEHMERRISHLWLPSPPTCAYQELHDESFSASPERRVESRYGTPICHFSLGSASPSRIEQTLHVSVLHGVWAVDVDSLGDYDLSNPEVALYLSPTARIQCQHAEIQALAEEIVSNETNPLLRCQRILTYVHSYGITQPINARPNFDALSVLRTRRGECEAFVALFVALARASGIPARPVSGIAYLQSGKQIRGAAANGYHIWAEFMLPDGGWIPVDPTTRMMGALEGDRIAMSWGCGFRLPSSEVDVQWFHMPIGVAQDELRGGVPGNDRQLLADVVVQKIGVRPVGLGEEDDG